MTVERKKRDANATFKQVDRKKYSLILETLIDYQIQLGQKFYLAIF